MFASKVVSRLSLLRRASGTLQAHGETVTGCVQPVLPAYCSSLRQKLRNYSTAADNTSPPRWVQLEPELEEALVPRKMSLSPLESWLSLRYSLPPLLEPAQPQEDAWLLEEKILPPLSVPPMEDGEGAATPIRCKNVLEIRRRKINRHKYKKLQKRIKFVKKKVREGRGRRKQRQFEEDMQRIWKKAGLKGTPEASLLPNVYLKYKEKLRK